MNRSILIVICDFLLVSLLAFSTIDINKVSDTPTQMSLQMDVSTNRADSGKDLAAVMRLALDDERKNRDLLLGELEQTRAKVGQQETLLSQREQQAQAIRTELESREQQAQRLQEEQSALQQQFAAARTNLQSLGEQLQHRSTESVISQEKVAALEAELRKQAEESAALQQKLAGLAQTNEAAQFEKQRLAGELQVAEVEKRHATEQVVRMQEQVKVEREEKAKLAEGVKALASRSGELVEEIRENRPLTPNSIFNEFVTNRIAAHIAATRPGVIAGESTRSKDAAVVLATDGTNTYALAHVDNTPLQLWVPNADWKRLAGTLGHNRAQVNIQSLSFQFNDPRIVWTPVSAADVRTLGARVYRLSTDPYKFQDAVLIGATEGYYGECRFEIDLSTPDYFRLDRSVLKGLFGKFNPSRGDLVFSKQGELLGVMANNSYCMVIRKFDPAAAIPFGQNLSSIDLILSGLYSKVREMPMKLQ